MTSEHSGTYNIWCIVPTHGAGDAFVRCIQSLINQTLKPSGIIIVDNNTSDDSIERVQKINSLNIQIKIIKLSENGGVSKGRNVGIANLPPLYDIVCFVDHDMTADPNLFEELLHCTSKSPARGIITPKIYYYERKDTIWAAGTGIDVKTGRTIFYGGLDKGQHDQDRQVQVAPAILFVKKAVIEKLKQFDETYFATYEDADFCFRAFHHGFQTWYASRAIAYHEIPYDKKIATLRLLSRAYWIGRNRYIFLRKFGLCNLHTLVYIPVYAGYYLMLSVKHKQFSAILKYIKGVWAGLTAPASTKI